MSSSIVSRANKFKGLVWSYTRLIKFCCLNDIFWSNKCTRISFAMLKSILVSIHGVRDKQGRKDGGTVCASDVAFGLIPEEKAYECR